jgi:hypothetical protein
VTATAPVRLREHAAMLLQAAVAEAALGEQTLARSRVDQILRTDGTELLAAAAAAADFLDRLTVTRGHEWTLGPVSGPCRGLGIERRVPRERALTLRLMAAWSSHDRDAFAALFQAAAADPDGAADLGDLFAYVLDWVAYRARRAGNPRGFVVLICKSIAAHPPAHPTGGTVAM